mmetsp:Transcript_101104/g.291010  ORF Transcript_101104/g.291010 Transcript_101104/m.291010 type:complete len:454 (-) Transcript_101104:155-1516(-)
MRRANALLNRGVGRTATRLCGGASGAATTRRRRRSKLGNRLRDAAGRRNGLRRRGSGLKFCLELIDLGLQSFLAGLQLADARLHLRDFSGRAGLCRRGVDGGGLNRREVHAEGALREGALEHLLGHRIHSDTADGHELIPHLEAHVVCPRVGHDLLDDGPVRRQAPEDQADLVDLRTRAHLHQVRSHSLGRRHHRRRTESAWRVGLLPHRRQRMTEEAVAGVEAVLVVQEHTQGVVIDARTGVETPVGHEGLEHVGDLFLHVLAAHRQDEAHELLPVEAPVAVAVRGAKNAPHEVLARVGLAGCGVGVTGAAVRSLSVEFLQELPHRGGDPTAKAASARGPRRRRRGNRAIRGALGRPLSSIADRAFVAEAVDAGSLVCTPADTVLCDASARALISRNSITGGGSAHGRARGLLFHQFEQRFPPVEDATQGRACEVPHPEDGAIMLPVGLVEL